jgi:DoxX-like family
MTKTRVLWIVQGLLALVFLFAGGVKLVLPVDALTKDTPMLSGGFLRFVGVCEVLGAIGLILPGLLRIRPGLTPLAAAGLIVIMIGAAAVTLMTDSGATAVFPFATGLLLAFIVYGRWRTAA